MSPIQVIAAIIVPLLWALQIVAVKKGGAEFPPLFLLGLRFLAMAVLLIPFARRPRLRELAPIAGVAIFMSVLNSGFYYESLRLGPGTAVAVTFQLQAPFTILLAWLILGERPSLRVSVGVLLAFVGVVIMAMGPGFSLKALPILLMTAAAFSLGVGNVLTKRLGPFDSLTLLGWSSLFAVAPILLASLAWEHDQAASVRAADAQGWLAVGYIVLLGGIVAFGLWFWLVTNCSMSRIAPFGLLLPPFGVAFSMVFLNEQLTYTLAAGGLLAFAGVAISQLDRSGSARTRDCVLS